MSHDRSLKTILFTDIVGSTERAAELGDRQWRSLLRRHDAAVRTQLRRHLGREINTAGDGFVAAFDDPERAILCARAVRDAVRELGLETRAGLHTGQVEGSGRSMGGIGVHIGARVAAKASANEVYVSQSVRDAVEGAGYGFEDKGAHELKGVPGEWHLFQVVALPEDAPDHMPTWRERWPFVLRQRAGVVTVVIAIAVIAITYGIVRDGGPTLSPDLAVAESAGPGIAILPFVVNDPELNRWREGMVDLLSTNLDGAGGLRAINSRTVLARWRQFVPADETADLPTALQIAQSSGARYALVGSVVSSGDNMRVVADLYDLESGTNLGQRQVEGAPVSIFELVDQLSIQALGLVLEEGDDELPTVNLAGITTQSVTALKSYLEGETLLRSSSFREAIPAYEEAIEADSTFALAYYRLSSALGWLETLGSGRAQETLDDAARFADRLPERDRNLLAVSQAYYDEHRRDSNELALVATQRYPDDPEAWFLLGEVYFHRPTQSIATREDQDGAFSRATDLDPSYTPAYIHQLDNAFKYADSTAATLLLEQYEQYAAGTEYDVAYETAYSLLFGDSLGRAQPSILDTLSTFVLGRIGNLFQHPRAFRIRTEVALRLADRPETRAIHDNVIPLIMISEGQFEEGLRVLAERTPPDDLYFEFLLAAYYGDIEEDFSELETAKLGPADSLPSIKWLVAALMAVEGGREQEADSIKTLALEFQDRFYTAGDSAQARGIEIGVTAVEGRQAMLAGRDEEALRLLDEVFRSDSSPPAFVTTWIVELLERMGRPEDAIRYASVFGPNPFLGIALGRLYEQIGDRDRALDAYSWVTLAWESPDPMLQPMVTEARRAIARLEGLQQRG
jgi:tetratricopeptide (TPR) repeat protein